MYDTSSSSIVAIASVCGRDNKKFNCEGSLHRPMRLLKDMSSLQMKGCITLPQISKDSQTHVTCWKCQLVRTHHINKHREIASSSSFASGLLSLCHFSELHCQNFTIDGRRYCYGCMVCNPSAGHPHCCQG